MSIEFPLFITASYLLPIQIPLFFLLCFMGYFLRYRLNLKIFLSFLMIILITTVTALSIGYSMIRTSLEQEYLLRLLRTVYLRFFNEIVFTKDECLAAVKNLSEDGDIAFYVKQRDKLALEKRLGSYYRIGAFRYNRGRRYKRSSSDPCP